MCLQVELTDGRIGDLIFIWQEDGLEWPWGIVSFNEGPLVKVSLGELSSPAWK